LGEIRAADALAFISHLTEEVWKTRFGISSIYEAEGKDWIMAFSHSISMSCAHAYGVEQSYML